MNDYVLSASGVRVYRTPEAHPLLWQTDTTHPSVRDKLAETGSVGGLPRILSGNSEDARTWYYFSRLLYNSEDRHLVLEDLIRRAIPETVSTEVLNAIPSAELTFWPKLSPPPSRPVREGDSEPDILIKLGDKGLVLVEAKYRSDVSERTTHDEYRDQVIRLIDVGSWHSRRKNLRDQDSGQYNSYLVVLQYGDSPSNVEEVVERYAGKPEAIERALFYRTDLTDGDFRRLAGRVGFVRWPDPLNL